MRPVTDFNFQLVPQVGSELTFCIHRSERLEDDFSAATAVHG